MPHQNDDINKNQSISTKILKSIFDYAPIGVFQSTLQGKFIYVNFAISSMLGYASQEDLIRFVNKSSIANTIYEDPNRYPMLLSETTQSEGVWKVFENRYKRKDGIVIDAILSISERLDSDTGHLSFFGFVQDISEKKRSENALKQSEYRLKDAQHLAGIGSFHYDARRDQSWWSEELFRLYGLKPKNEPMSLAAASSFTHPEDRHIGNEMMQQALLTGDAVEFEYRVVWPDASIHYHHAISRVKTDKNHQMTEICGTIQDITERKHVEQEKQKIEQQLNQAQKLESLGVLASGIAHDFNNLLGGIFGYIDLAKTFTKDETTANLLAKSLITMDRAKNLTMQLLTFAKGGSPIRKIESLSPFLEEAVQFALSGSNVSCMFNIPADLWRCDIDKNQISQVIDNIVINAIQAMPSGGTIEISACNTLTEPKNTVPMAAGHYIKLSFKDHGIGIPQQILPLIFDPFFTTKTKGHGLGLTTSYSIISRHGGYIEVESEPGIGSTFHIFLPASEEDISSTKIDTVLRHKGAGTFLIMDDEPVIRDAISVMLGSFGYSVVLMENGKDTIDYFLAEKNANRICSGMILDLTIPGGKGGKETVTELRKIDAEIPIFVMSGYADDPVMANPGAYGFTASICKPFKTVELAEMLEKYLKK